MGTNNYEFLLIVLAIIVGTIILLSFVMYMFKQPVEAILIKLNNSMAVREVLGDNIIKKGIIMTGQITNDVGNLSFTVEGTIAKGKVYASVRHNGVDWKAVSSKVMVGDKVIEIK